MSNYDDRLKTLREEALETQETFQDLPADAWPSKATRSRTLGVFGYARTILETTDPELLRGKRASRDGVTRSGRRARGVEAVAVGLSAVAGPAAFLLRMPTLFKDRGPLRDRLGEAVARARASVESVPDDDAVGRDRDEWVDALVQRAQIAPPGLG